jgi:CBS domain-containing protein
MRIGDFFSKEVVSVEPTATLSEVARQMDEHGVGAIVVVEQQRPVGIVTDRDVALALGTGRAIREEPVQEIMTCPPATLNERDGIFSATQQMKTNAIRRLPVVDDVGRLIGIVSLDDLFLLLSEELHNLAQGIEPEVVAAK